MSIQRLNQELPRIQHELNTGVIIPNLGDRRNHIYKVVTGQGKNSKKNDPILRKEIPRYIRDELCKEICDVTEQGVVLVRL